MSKKQTPPRIDLQINTLSVTYAGMGIYTCVSDQYDPECETAGAGRTPVESISDWVESNREEKA
jgi:hypothetical protein